MPSNVPHAPSGMAVDRRRGPSHRRTSVTAFVLATALIGALLALEVTPAAASVRPGAPLRISAWLYGPPARAFVKWSPSARAGAYRVYRNGRLLATQVRALRYVDRTVRRAKTYFYSVKACNPSGCSGLSRHARIAMPWSAPRVPTWVKAARNRSGVLVDWPASNRATKYRVVRDGRSIAWHLRRTQYLDRRARRGVAHSYAVRACNALGCSVSKNRATGAKPSTPTGLNAVPTAPVRIALSWRAASRATRYRLYRNGALVRPGLTTTRTVDSSVAPAITYAYSVQACNRVGCSRVSSRVRVKVPGSPPPVPTDVTSTAQRWSQVSVAWSGSVRAVSYRVYRDGSQIASGVTVGRYDDYSVVGSTTYSYTVSACNAAGCSAPSAPATVTTPGGPPGDGSDPTITPEPTRVTLDWTDDPNVQTYRVFRDGVVVATVTSPRYVDTNVQPGSLYWYFVEGCNSVGCSRPGNPGAAWTPQTPSNCSGVDLSPGDDVQAAIRSHPSGTTFCFAPGLYHVAATIVPKSDDVLWGAPGAVLTGDDTVSEGIRGYGDYQSGVTVRGFTVQHFLGDIGAVSMGTGWVVEDNDISYNDGVGLRAAADAVVRSNAIHHNGQFGLAGGPQSNMLFDGNEIAYNNTHHYSNWSAGGTKIVKSSWVTFRGNYVHDNWGNGLHCDTNCIHVIFAGNLVASNQDAGITHEASYDAAITNNFLVGNDTADAGKNLFFGSQLYLNDSQNVEIAGNVVRSTIPGMGGIGLYDLDRGTGPYGVYRIANDYIHDNVVELLGGGKNGLVGSVHDPSSAAANNRFVDNTYYVVDPSAEYFYWCTGKTPLTWTRWQEKGQDQAGAIST